MEFIFSEPVSEFGHSAFCPIFMLRNLFSSLFQMVLSTSSLKVIYTEARPPVL